MQAIYPLKINLKINRFVIQNADVTYVDKGPFRPLQITNLNLIAENIRNVESETGTYPSPVHVEGIVFETGTIKLDGHADFLAEPHVGIKGDLQIENVILDYFKPNDTIFPSAKEFFLPMDPLNTHPKRKNS